MRHFTTTLALSALCMLTACPGICPKDLLVAPNAPADIPCVTDEDCAIEISIWTPTCDGNTLLTPTGSGEAICVDNLCDVDFFLEETDCETLNRQCITFDSDEGAGCMP